MKPVCLMMGVVFTASAWAAPASVFWCGEFIALDNVRNLEELLLEEHPHYFESAIVSGRGVRQEGRMRFFERGRGGIPALQIAGHLVSFRYQFATIGADAIEGTPLEWYVSVQEVESAGSQTVLAAMTRNGGILISEDRNYISLCQDRDTRSFADVATFLKRLPIKLNTFVENLDVEAHLQLCAHRLTRKG